MPTAFSAPAIMTNAFGYADQPLSHTSHFMELGGYRHYNPKTGVFLSGDSDTPFYQRQTNNGYNYATGNPIIYQDPSGHMSQLAWNVLGTGIGLLSGIGSTYFVTGYAQIMGFNENRMNFFVGATSTFSATATSQSMMNIPTEKNTWTASNVLNLTLQTGIGGMQGVFEGMITDALGITSPLGIIALDATDSGVLNTIQTAGRKTTAKQMLTSTGLAMASGGGMSLAAIHAKKYFKHNKETSSFITQNEPDKTDQLTNFQEMKPELMPYSEIEMTVM